MYRRLLSKFVKPKLNTSVVEPGSPVKTSGGHDAVDERARRVHVGIGPDEGRREAKAGQGAARLVVGGVVQANEIGRVGREAVEAVDLGRSAGQPRVVGRTYWPAALVTAVASSWPAGL